MKEFTRAFLDAQDLVLTAHIGLRCLATNFHPSCRVDTLVKVAVSLEVSADDLLDGITWTPGDYRPGGFVESV